MELILKEAVQNLGFKDEIVNVKNGYGRNFLIPQGKAIIATESAPASSICLAKTNQLFNVCTGDTV